MTVNLEKLDTPKVITCVKCNKDIKRLVARTEELIDDRIGHYFRCDNCGEKYPFLAITKKGVSLLEGMKKTRRDIRNFPDLRKGLFFKLKKQTAEYQKEVEDTYTEEDVL